MTAYFTGVWPGSRGGHFCFTPSARTTLYGHFPTPWGESSSYPLGDGKPCRAAWPEAYDRWGAVRHPSEQHQPEGRARVVRQDGWTLVCLWDRSADGRGNSHASFALHADLEPDAALQQARALFPGVFERIERHLGRPVVLDGAPTPSGAA